MVIKNNEAKVLVLKAIGHPVLRLLPGYNKLPSGVKDLKPYCKGNEAAKAMVDESLEVYDGKLNAEEQAQANASKEKNERLNKSSILLKKTQEALVEAEKSGNASNAEVGALKSQLEEQGKALAKAMEQIELLLAAQTGDPLSPAKKAVDDAQDELDRVKAADGSVEEQNAALDLLTKAQTALSDLENGE